MLPALPDYEKLVYSLQAKYSEIRYSTLVIKRVGPFAAKLVGKLFFRKNIELGILEVLDLNKKAIINYSYEVYKDKEKQYWYDSWSHPDDETLAATDPHHKHVPPDIKHNRIPVPDISFDKPNLPFLIEEILREYFLDKI